ncbi:MAG TPA: hypothetical protein VMF65_20920, partial [Acidimicrobiales bacterium]|nr:hypothetical protein [Acidimicrobiales bacterium]
MGYRDLMANTYKLTASCAGGHSRCSALQPAAPFAQLPLGQIGGQGGPSCRCDGPGVTVLVKPFDLGRPATQGLTSRPPKGGTMRSTSHTVDLDEVGSVKATV